MNIKDLHPAVKGISAISLFKGKEGMVKTIHLSTGSELTKHQSKINALLLCIDGEVVFENDNGVKEILKQGDYVIIEPLVNHWVKSNTDSYLLLMK